MIRWMLERLERDPHAVFYEKELLERFPDDFSAAVESRLLRLVPIGSRYGHGLARSRMLEALDDGTYEAIDDEEPEEAPVELTEADVRRWGLNLDEVARQFHERNRLSGERGALTSQFHYLGEADGTAYVLGLLHERKAARESLAGLPELLPRILERTVVTCPTFVPPPERAWAPAGISVLAFCQSDLFLLPLQKAEPDGEENECVLRKDGDHWFVRYEGRTFSIRNLKGFQYIAAMLAYPGREFTPLKLASGGDISDGERPALAGEELRVAGLGDAGPALDPKARDEYQQRVRNLATKLEAGGLPEAKRTGLTNEKAFLEKELARAVGLGGRSRPIGSATERARSNVAQAVRRTIKAIEEHEPALAQFLHNTIKTGYTCSYSPDRPIRWTT